MPDNETTPEYGAWVEARRIAVEAQRADLEAAIRRLEQSLAEDKKMGRWLFISGPDISSPQKPKGDQSKSLKGE